MMARCWSTSATAIILGVPLLLAQSSPEAAPVKRVAPMAKGADPAFEVASIKPSTGDPNHSGFTFEGDRFIIQNESVFRLINLAFQVHRNQIVGAPNWVRENAYDIYGKPDVEGEPNLLQQEEMIQKLLADRFKLRFHREQRELPVYAIRIDKGGPKLAPAADPDALALEQGNGHGYETTQTYTNNSMKDFARWLQFFLDRPAIDQTNLTGRYDFRLNYTYGTIESTSTDPNAPPGLFTAIREQLGLRLEPTKALVDVFVIDHIEGPSAN
jgi:uncharacterized protein (TIGR03435 family)